MGRKKRPVGRPKIGAKPVMVRFPPALLERLDTYCAKQKPRPTRPEAARQLIEIALSKTDKK